MIYFEFAKSSSLYNPTLFQVLKLTNLESMKKTIQFHLNVQQSLKTLVKFFWLKYGKMYVQGGFAIHMQGGGKTPIYCYELL